MDSKIIVFKLEDNALKKLSMLFDEAKMNGCCTHIEYQQPIRQAVRGEYYK
jgi:hypothetical protein